MRALTIHQPYAHLIAIGGKLVENRRWRTPYRGPIAIHAGKQRHRLAHGDDVRWPDMAFGAIVAVTELVECLSIGEIDRLAASGSDLHRLLGIHRHTTGPICWCLANVTRIDPPIPCSGRQGLWTPGQDIQRRLAAAVDCRLTIVDCGLEAP